MSQFPGRTGDALVVIDAQAGVLAACVHPAPVVATIGDLVDRARLAGTPVVWVQDVALGPGSDDWQVTPELIPAPGEPIVQKTWQDAFAETNLADLLAEAGADHLWVCGAMSHACVRSTCFGGLYRGYDVTLVADAHATRQPRDVTADQMVQVINQLVGSTSLPGVQAAVARHDEVAFAPATRLDDDDRLEALEAEEQAEEDADDVALGLVDSEPEA